MPTWVDNVKHILKSRGRDVELSPEERPSCTGVLEVGNEVMSFADYDITTAQAARGQFSGEDTLAERLENIVRRYGEITFRGGISGLSGCKFMTTDPGFRDAPGEFRIKYVNPEDLQKTFGEIWKHVLFAEWLNSEGQLGWSLFRDWPADVVKDPPYVVMIKGKESLASKLVADQNDAAIDDAITFIREYSFEHPTGDWRTIGHHADLMIESLRRYTKSLSEGNESEKKVAEEWSQKLESIRTRLRSHLESSGKGLRASWTVSDAKTQNLMYANGNGKPHLYWVDQGYRQDLLDTWLRAREVEPKKEHYFEAFYGAPQINIGQMHFSVQTGDTLPETVKEKVAGEIKQLVDKGVWGYDRSGRAVKQLGWGPETSKLAAGLINLGELTHAIPMYYRTRAPAWKELTDLLMANTLTDTLFVNLYRTQVAATGVPNAVTDVSSN